MLRPSNVNFITRTYWTTCVHVCTCKYAHTCTHNYVMSNLHEHERTCTVQNDLLARVIFGEFVCEKQ